MKSLFDKWNLRPQERRLIVVVLLAFFVLFNIWFIWPYFGQWSTTRAAMDKSRSKLARYNAEIARKPQYEKKLAELSTTGEMLINELELQRIVQTQAAAAGLQITSSDPRFRGEFGRTNQFFQEQALSIQFAADGKELVDFLVGVAAGNSLIRVQEMNVRPDPSQTRLVGNVVLVGNYQKKQTNSAAAVKRRGGT